MCCDLAEYRARIGYFGGGLRGASLFHYVELNTMEKYQFYKSKWLHANILGFLTLLNIIIDFVMCVLLCESLCSMLNPSYKFVEKVIVVMVIFIIKFCYYVLVKVKKLSYTCSLAVSPVNMKTKVNYISVNSLMRLYLNVLFKNMSVILFIILLLSGDIHPNPGPPSNVSLPINKQLQNITACPVASVNSQCIRH